MPLLIHRLHPSTPTLLPVHGRTKRGADSGRGLKSLLARAAFVAGLAVGGFATQGCSQAPEDEGVADQGELRADETEYLTLVSDVASTDPQGTGVDVWRVGVVHSASTGWMLVLTGSMDPEKKRDVLEVVVTTQRYIVRSPDETVALSISSARASALEADLDALARRVRSSKVAIGVSPQSLRPLGTGASIGGCLGDTAAAAMGTVGTALFGAAAAIACPVGSVFTSSVGLVIGDGRLTQEYCEFVSEPVFVTARWTGKQMSSIPESCLGIPGND